MRLNSTTLGGAAVVVATTALVVALTTGAIALPGTGSVDSGDIQKNAVKEKHLAASALKCPANMRRVGALCYDKQPRAALNTWLDALYKCADVGRELPSWQELLRVAQTGGYPTGEGELWTAETDGGNSVAVEKIASNNIPSLYHPVADNYKFRCVKEATP